MNDRHVLATAIVGEAEVLLTDNLKDFPLRILSKHGLTRNSIDSFLWELCSEAPELINRLVERAFDLHKRETQSDATSKKSFLKKYGLSRLAKCIMS